MKRILLLLLSLILVPLILAAPPTWDFSQGNFNLQEDSGTTAYDLRTFASDPENNPLNFTLNSQSNASVINCALAADGFTLNCTTVANQSGTSTVQVTVNDSEVPPNSVSGSFTLTVAAVNDAPTITATIANLTAVEAVPFSFTLPATGVSDVDNPVTDISIDPAGLPAWLTVNGLTITGTPTANDKGSAPVNLRVTDGQATSAAKTFTLTVDPALEILQNSVEIQAGGDIFDANDQLNVSPGNQVTVSYNFANNFNKALGSVSKEAHLTVGTDFVNHQATEWALFAGEVEDDEFTFTVPLAVSGNSFTVRLSLSHNSFKGTFQDTFDLTFNIVREEADVEISSATLTDNTLSCNRVTDLTVTATNTGDNAVTPQLLVYGEQQFEFDADAGEFTGEELLNEALSATALQPGATATAQFSLNLTNLEPGQNKLFVYLVNPDFTDFQGSSAEVPLTVSDCLTTFTPAEDELLVRPNTMLTFQANIAESTFKQFLKWYIDGSLTSSKQMRIVRTLAPGVHTVEVRLQTDLGLMESHSWDVTVTNKPRTTNLNLPNFDETKDSANYQGFVVENSNGKITFNQAVDLTGILQNNLMLDNVIQISHQSNKDTIAVNTAAAPGLGGRSATVTLPRTAPFTNPRISVSSGFNSGTLTKCPATICQIVSNTASQLVFTVTGFSTYVVEEERAAALTVLPATEILFDNVNTGQAVNTTVTISNTGTHESLTGLSAQLLGVNATYNAQLTGTLSSTLAAGGQTPLQLSLTIPAGEASGKHSIGTLRIVSNQGTVNLPIFLNPKSFLTVQSVKINGKTDGKFKLDDTNTVKVDVKNELNQDLEDIQVTVTLKNINEDELEEESDEFDLKSGRDDDVELDFDLRNEDVSNEEFTMEIVVEGEAKDGTRHTTMVTQIVKLELENHNVAVKTATLDQATLQCQRQTNLQVTVQNIGKSNEDDVEIKARNTALGLDQAKRNIELDDFAGNDNEQRVLFSVNAENAPAGTYPLTVEVYRDGKLDDTKEVSLEVKACAQPTTTPGTTAQPAEQKKEVVIDVASQKLADEMQKQLQARQAVQSQPDVRVSTSFRDTDTYLFLLAAFVVLVFMAVLLGVMVMMVRRKP